MVVTSFLLAKPSIRLCIFPAKPSISSTRHSTPAHAQDGGFRAPRPSTPRKRNVEDFVHTALDPRACARGRILRTRPSTTAHTQDGWFRVHDHRPPRMRKMADFGLISLVSPPLRMRGQTPFPRRPHANGGFQMAIRAANQISASIIIFGLEIP